MHRSLGLLEPCNEVNSRSVWHDCSTKGPYKRIQESRVLEEIQRNIEPIRHDETMRMRNQWLLVNKPVKFEAMNRILYQRRSDKMMNDRTRDNIEGGD